MNDEKQALEKIVELVEKFRTNEEDYKKDTYLEMNVRSNFIDLFFEAINWDVYGKKLLPVSESEVIREEHVSEKNKKRVDYAFRTDGAVRFIVEAKKPSESLNNLNHIFQAKSYAFSMGVNLAILTNFKEFKVFDLKSKPLYNQPEVDCVEEFTLEYQEYPDKFDRIWRLFEYNNVLSGALEKFYFENRKGMSQKEIDDALKQYSKKGGALLNKAFLADLLVWRENIAKSLYEKNKNLDTYTINEVVQRFIDRIIFLRIVEDRGIEGKELLAPICSEWFKDKSFSLQEKLEEKFGELNHKYNGMLFKDYAGFKVFEMGDQVIYDFIMALYVPNSPYNFAIIDIDILGKIFEQYLGYTIVLNYGDLHLECKNEVQKNAGIYYTRQEIVDKIVEESILKPISCIETLEELSSFKILDMSCGSGTFLIEAYRGILNRYEEIISELIVKGVPLPENCYFIDNGIVHLTMSYKKEIVMNNIFGVDIDPQAVEVAKMSMYILMLELNYKDDTVRPILPSLEDNFKVGNSIISEDYYQDGNIDIEEDRIINPFNYEDEFSSIFEHGGFDCIIGNPPYIKMQVLNRAYPQKMIDYINQHYSQTARGNYDVFVVFIEKALCLLKDNGNFGMIVLNNFFTSDYGEGLRELLSRNKYIKKIIDFGDQQVFDNSTVYTCLLFLKKCCNEEFLYTRVLDYNAWKTEADDAEILISGDSLKNEPWLFSDEIYDTLLKEVFTNCQSVKAIAKVFGGVQPTTNKIYLLTVVKSDEMYEYCVQDGNKEVYKLEKEALKVLVKGSRDIRCYEHSSNRRLIFPYEVVNGKAELIKEEEYRKRYPETYAYLLSFREVIDEKHKEKDCEKPWYRYEYVKNHGLFEQPKILIPAMVYGSRFSFDEKGDAYITCGGPSAGGGKVLTLLENNDGYSYYSLLAILNSSLISYLIVRNGIPKNGGWQGIGKKFMDDLPIPNIGNDKNRKKLLIDLENKAKKLIELYNYNPYSESDNLRKNKRIVKLRIAVDAIVFELYGVDEEIQKMIIDDLTKKGYR